MNAVQLYQALAEHKSRESFYAFRQYMNPKMKIGWWQRDVARHLQQFADDLAAGRRPTLIIEAPPQHGKSYQIIDFIAWLAGKYPDLKTIYSSFSERLGIRANLRLQRLYDSPKYQGVFPHTRINSSNVVSQSGQFLRNREILEYVDREGYFRNTTVGGPITGEGLDLGVIDDPIKGREAANSPTIRNKTWEWYTDDFRTRFSDAAGLLIILTRWHLDDPVGRLIDQRGDAIKVLRYPALAEVDEPYRKKGEPLFPEHKSLEFLLEQKATMSVESWESLYQQNPVKSGGNLFKLEDLRPWRDLPPLAWRAIYVDTAQKTKERHDYSVFQHWGKGHDGRAYLIDQVRDKFEAPELEATARLFWTKAKVMTNGHLRAMKIEDKASGTGLIQSLKRPPNPIPIVAVQRTTDKYSRGLDAQPSLASGLVHFPADWIADRTNPFVQEYLAFPDGKNDDQIDPMIDAIMDMCGQVNLYTKDNIG